MWLVWGSVIFAVLWYFEVGWTAQISGWWVLAPFAAAFVWFEVFAGEKANEVYGPNTWLHDDTLEAIKEHVVAIKVRQLGIDFHAKTSPAVASILVKELEPLKLLFVEEPCPPENVKAMQRIAKRSTTPIAPGENTLSVTLEVVFELGK